MTGYAFCGSFCTLSRSLSQMKKLIAEGVDIQPIVSERVYTTDTRFYKAEDFLKDVEEAAGRKAAKTVEETELFGAKTPLDALIISPCTGNTLAKLANGITDSAVTMAAKAHLRCDRPILIALATNDAMSQNLKNISVLLTRRSVYFLPLCQDDPKGKPHSLVADFERLSEGYSAMQIGISLRPLFV